MQPIWGSKHNLYNWPHVVVYRPNWQKGLITQTRDLIFRWPNDTTFSTFCCFGATVKRQKQSVTLRVFSWEILLICCRSCHILKTTVASLNKTVYGPALLHFPHSTSHYVGDICSVSAQSLVAGADSWDPLPPPRLSLSLPPSRSLSLSSCCRLLMTSLECCLQLHAWLWRTSHMQCHKLPTVPVPLVGAKEHFLTVS